ncbi:MAG: PEP/pyruvate-binding domain-containing protein, partial [Bacteroidales bacterium]|nr:PEP/pyruvate-binding domain-containing protein [Bacteroidales bacterium]
MNPELQSKALEINLAHTRDLEIIIPSDHQWFISLSGNYWGIHKRTEDFFTEFHHPYSNRSFVVEQLPGILIGDFWFYQAHPDAIRAFDILCNIVSTLLKEKLTPKQAEQLVYTFLKFLENLSADPVNNKQVITNALDKLEENIETQTFSYIANLGMIFNSLKNLAHEPFFSTRIFNLTRNIISKNLNFWQSTTQIETWYRSKNKIFGDKYKGNILSLGKPFFDDQQRKMEAAEDWDTLVGHAFSFTDIAAAFRKFTDEFEKAVEKLHYLFFLLHLPGMVHQRDYLLWDLNRVIREISKELTEDQIIASIDDLFVLFEEFRQNYVGTVLDSVLTLGKEIMNSSNLTLIRYFENKLIRMGFVTPGVVYLTDNWQLHVDRNHIKNIRVWLELIEYAPEVMKKLLSALIINLRLGGIFIFDTDLFQRDVTRLLNSNIAPIYKRIKQLTRIFPVYFSEIGAEGELREVTTSLDETTQRADKLIHFLRKQIHTEGNNSHIRICLEILNFWKNLRIDRLKSLIPADVLSTIDVNGPWVSGVHQVVNALCETGNLSVNQLSELESNEIDKMLSTIDVGTEHDVRRVQLLIRLYKLLKEKYSFETVNIAGILNRYNFFTAEEIQQLSEYLDNSEDEKALKLIFNFMSRLNQIIFDPNPSQGWENIYHKRHIAFGIPSMYGEYHEKKFEALGVTFRLEGIASVLMERIIGKMNTDYITAKTLKNIYSILELLKEGLELDGIPDQGFDSNLQMLQYSLSSGSFTIGQYLNIFQFMGESVKEIINHYFLSSYDDLLKLIIPQIFPSEAKQDQKSLSKFIHKKSESFFRDLLSSAFLIQSLDNFIGKVMNSLHNMADNFSPDDIRQIMSYDPDVVISPFNEENPLIDSQIFLGSKGYFLKKLFLTGYSVPPGFILTTEVFRRMGSILKHPSLHAEIDNMITQHIRALETITHREFANPLNPLLLSVRSGSAISMPGAMNTFLNVGLNDEITETLSKQSNFGWTSWDCYRRLLQTWGMSYGIERDVFDQVMLEYKQKYDITRKIDFSPAIMREIAFTYKDILKDQNVYFEPDPLLQARQAIIEVFNSWNNTRAKAYRSHLQIAQEWGTAVIVQQMVFGNIHRESGSGVVFTCDIRESAPGIHLNGDFSFLSHGEDIVAGLVNTLPISEAQRKKYYLKSPFSLESAFPKIFNKLN